MEKGEKFLFKRVHHVAYTVDDMEKYIDIFSELLGEEPQEKLTIEDAGYKVTVFDLEGIFIEVQEPTDDPDPGSVGSEMKEFLGKNGPGLNHVAYEVEDLPEAVQKMKKLGIKAKNEEPIIAPSFPSERIVDLEPESTKKIFFQIADRKG